MSVQTFISTCSSDGLHAAVAHNEISQRRRDSCWPAKRDATNNRSPSRPNSAATSGCTRLTTSTLPPTDSLMLQLPGPPQATVAVAQFRLRKRLPEFASSSRCRRRRKWHAPPGKIEAIDARTRWFQDARRSFSDPRAIDDLGEGAVLLVPSVDLSYHDVRAAGIPFWTLTVPKTPSQPAMYDQLPVLAW